MKLIPLRNGEIRLSLYIVGKSPWLRSRMFNVATMSFNVIRENKSIARIFEFTISYCDGGLTFGLMLYLHVCPYFFK